MELLPHTPRSFRELVEADLRRGARMIIKIQDEIDWHFRMATRDGDYALAVTMPHDDDERRAMLRRIATFMAWKQVAGFSLTVETFEPDAIYCAGISVREKVSCMARIKREPRPWAAVNFSQVEWLSEASIDPAIASLLPVGSRAMTPKEIAALQKWFGVAGKFPAVHVPSGEVRGL